MSSSQPLQRNIGDRSLGEMVKRAGRITALAGVILPLFLIGILKFTAVEIDGLKPLIGGTPWLAWLYGLFGVPGASHFLGAVEITTALFLLISPWSARAAVAGGAVGALTFLLTASILFAVPIWEPASGGFPWLNDTGTFLIKDVALLGISLFVLGEGLDRVSSRSAAAAP
jgi:reactive chlorine resistance protein C